jgi:hypothetical protein
LGRIKRRHYFADNQFREYHAPNGQVLGLGQNAITAQPQENIGTCWEIKNKEEVCYYNYAQGLQGHSSQNFVDAGKPGEIRGIAADTPDVFMVGKILEGNPFQLTSDAQWTCRDPVAR